MTTTDMTTTTLDEAELEVFIGQVVVDMGSAISGRLLDRGDRLGLCKAMASAGPITSATLDQRSGTAERSVREWFSNQAAGGYVVYDPTASKSELPAEQAMVLANEASPRRTDLLRPVHGHLHPAAAGPGSRSRARRAGRGTPPRDAARGRVQPRASGNRAPFNMILEARP